MNARRRTAAVRGKGRQPFAREAVGGDTPRQRGTLSNGLRIEDIWQRVAPGDEVD